MPKNRAIGIGVVCGAIAAAVQAWMLLHWLGFGFWFLALVVPMSLLTMQAVGGTIAAVLMRGS